MKIKGKTLLHQRWIPKYETLETLSFLLFRISRFHENPNVQPGLAIIVQYYSLCTTNWVHDVFSFAFPWEEEKEKELFFIFSEGVATSGVLVHVQYNSIVNGNCCVILLYYIYNGGFLHPNKINRSFKRLKATPNKSTIINIKILLLPTGTNTLSLAAWTNH